MGLTMKKNYLIAGFLLALTVIVCLGATVGGTAYRLNSTTQALLITNVVATSSSLGPPMLTIQPRYTGSDFESYQAFKVDPHINWAGPSTQTIAWFGEGGTNTMSVLGNGQMTLGRSDSDTPFSGTIVLSRGGNTINSKLGGFYFNAKDSTGTALTMADVSVGWLDNTHDATIPFYDVMLRDGLVSPFRALRVTPRMTTVSNFTAYTATVNSLSSTGAVSAGSLTTPTASFNNTTTTNTQTVSNMVVNGSFQVSQWTVAALDIDWARSGHYKSISADSTFTFSNTNSGKAIKVQIANTAATNVLAAFPSYSRSTLYQTNRSFSVPALSTNYFTLEQDQNALVWIEPYVGANSNLDQIAALLPTGTKALLFSNGVWTVAHELPSAGSASFATNASSGFMFPDLIKVLASSAGTLTANGLYGETVELRSRQYVRSVSITIGTADAAGFWAFAIYDHSGTTKLFDTGAQSTAATGVNTLAVTWDIQPGVYRMAFSTSTATAQIRVNGTSDGGLTTLINTPTIKHGTLANASAAGVMPATTGAYTSSTAAFPIVSLQNNP